MRRLHQDARDQTGKAEQKLALAVSNNVGAEVAKTFFVSMTYALGALGAPTTANHSIDFNQIFGL